jgi:phospholipid/cholesterol/gamma-HCH transport system substrate-binding protein
MSRLDRLYMPPEIGAPGRREGRARRRDLFWSGLFVLAMAGVLVLAVAQVVPGLFGGQYRLLAYFLEAEGLDSGIQVIQDGFVIGMVEEVRPVFPGRDAQADLCPPQPADRPPRSPALPCYETHLRIRAAWPVPIDSQAQLGSAGLLAGQAIKIAPGSSAAVLGDGAVIPAAGRERDLMAQLSALTEALDGVVQDTIAPALESIKAQIQTVEGLIGGSDEDGALSENRDRLAGAFENLKKLTADLEQAVDPGKIAAILGSVERMSAHLAEVSSKLTGSTEAVQQTVRNYGDLATDIQGLVGDTKPGLTRSLDDAQYLLQELSSSLTPILTNIEDATRNLSALSRDLRQNPAVIIRGHKQEDQTPWFR